MKPIKHRILTTASVAIFCSTLALPAFSGTANNDNSEGEKHKQHLEHKSTEGKDRYGLSKPELRNAWLEGKLETALLVNRHLNNFTIDNEVRDGKATLTGTVESDIDRDLAEQVTLSIKGIEKVDNQLKVDAEKGKPQQAAHASERPLSQKLDDMTTTAEIKSKLLANKNTNGLSIDVETHNRNVSLTGNATSSEEKQLAEKIAANTDGVQKVNNLLEVKPNS